MTPSRRKRFRFVKTGADRGAVVLIIALLLPALLATTAFAVDLGRQRSDRRSMQAIADVVALDMSRLADGRTLAEIQTGDAANPPAETALSASAERNGIDRTKLTLDWGIWDEVSGFLSVLGDATAIPDAVKIVASDTTEYYFQPGSGGVTRTAIGQYGLEPVAAFSVGSFATTLDSSQSAFLEQFVTPLLGGPATLTAAGYESLAGARFKVGDLAPYFAAVTPRQLLDAEVYLDEVLLAAAQVLRNQDPPKTAEADLLESSITPEIAAISLNLADVVYAEGGAEDSAMGATIDAVDLLQAGAFIGQCTADPNGFEDCNGIAVPAIETSLPLLSSTGTATIVQSPRYGYGDVGTFVDTAQIQLDLDTKVGAREVGQCQPTEANALCLLDGLLVDWVDATVTVAADITIAGGRTTIKHIGCTDPAALELALRSNTQLYEANLTVQVDFGRRGVLGGLLGPLVGTTTLTGSTSEPATFDDVLFTVAPDVLGETMKTTGTGEVGLQPITLTTSSTDALDTLALLEIDQTLEQVMTTYVNPVLLELDQDVLRPLTRQLGLNVSGSDLIAHLINCENDTVELVG